MTLYKAFADELQKLAKKDRLDPMTAAVAVGSAAGSGSVLGGLASEIFGGYKRPQPRPGGDRYVFMGAKRTTPRGHKFRKWGRRAQRGGLALLAPSIIARTLLQRRKRRD